MSYSRPLLILGQGVHIAHVVKEAIGFIEKLQWPVLLTWGALDLLPCNHPLNIGVFGVCGSRWANKAIQEADYLLVIGARIDQNITGRNPGLFAPKAAIEVVDNSRGELEKFTRLGIKVAGNQTDLKDYLVRKSNINPTGKYQEWLNQIRSWQTQWDWRLHPDRNADSWFRKDETGQLSPYDVITEITQASGENDIIVTDAGATLCWTFQNWQVKIGQRLFSSFNHSPMGYALPAAIGAAFACPNRPVICITGDGSFQMNIQELATIRKHKLNIKICVVDNRGYGIIRQTQNTWLEGRTFATMEDSNVDLKAISLAYGIPEVTIYPIDPRARIIPKMGKGKTIEDLE